MKRTQTAFFRRCLAALVCLCTTVCAAALPAGAQEPEYPYTYPAEQPYYEMSMYGFFKDASDEENDLVYTVGTFRLLDAQGGQSLAYCADAEIFDEPGFRYRPVALTELPRTSASADKLRAFPLALGGHRACVHDTEIAFFSEADDVEGGGGFPQVTA